VLLAFWLLLFAVPNAVILGLLRAVLNAAEIMYGVLQYSRRIMLIPDHLQGRANSAFRLFSFGAEPFGAAASRALLGSFGLSTTFAVFAGLLAVLALGAALDGVIRQA